MNRLNKGTPPPPRRPRCLRLATVDDFAALQLAGHGALPAILPPAPAWQRHAACAGMELDSFYPERGDRTDVRFARAVCGDCPVVRQCLSYALANDEHGLWGGTSREQRKTMGRQQAA